MFSEAVNSDERVKLMCECVSRDESDVARGVYGEATFFGAFGTISSNLRHLWGTYLVFPAMSGPRVNFEKEL